MAEDKYDSEAEYQFNDSQPASEEQEPGLQYDYDDGAAASAPKPKRSKKPIFIIVGVIILLFIVYKVFFSGRSDTRRVEQTSVSTQQKAVSNLAALEKKESVHAAPQTHMQAQQQQPTFAQQQAALDQQKTAQAQAANQKLVSNLEKQQFQTQTNLMSLQESVSSVNSKLSAINQNLNQLNQANQAREVAAKEKAHERALAHARAEAAIRRKKEYFVDAVIPGRAWLKGKDGSTITVTVGENLPGYGRVLSIDPYSGVVRTTKMRIPYGLSNS